MIQIIIRFNLWASRYLKPIGLALFCLFCSQFIFGQDLKPVTIQLENGTSLKAALSQLHKASKVNFAYDEKVIAPYTITAKDFKDNSVPDILKKILEGKPLQFKKLNGVFVIRPASKTTQDKRTSEINQLADRTTDGSLSSGQRTILVVGVVKDSLGHPMSAVTVGQTVTDPKGRFRLKVTGGSHITFSYTGYMQRSILVHADTSMVVIMAPATETLETVSVTALGIKRSERSLGYSISEVNGKDLQRTKDVNVVNSLAGRVPGLIIDQTATGPSGSTRVILRGYTDMTGDNQPLYVVDGVPIDNTNFSSAGEFGGYDLGNGISSINPDDIETLSVLKGPAASALYGSRAAHGVILITTKKAAKSRQALGIQFSSNTTLDFQATHYDDVQYQYGQGSDGRLSTTDNKHTSNSNWGPLIDPGIQVLQFDGIKRPYVPIADNIDGFFRTGRTFNNTVTLNSVNDENGIRFSYGDLRNEDIVPNTKMTRNNISLRGNTKVGHHFDIDVKLNYIREYVKNRSAVGEYQSSVGRNLVTLANTFNQDWLKANYEDAAGNYFDWNNRDPYNLNPYWVLNRMKNESTKNRFISAANVKYTFSKTFDVKLTGGTDFNFFDFYEFAPPSTPGKELGYMQTRNYNNKTYNIQLLASYNTHFNDLSLAVRGGGNLFHADNYTELITAQNMQLKDAIALSSFTTKELNEISYRKQINSVFSMANLGYKNYLFVDGTIRGDKASSLTKPDGSASNNVYWYPSVSGSFVFTDAFHLKSQVLNFGKIRISWAQVGSDTDPYKLGLIYGLFPNEYTGYPIGSISNSTAPNAHLKPTKTNSTEFGLEMKFFQNKVGLDITYYDQVSSNQIMKMAASSSSGYKTALINAGKIQNKGIEIALNTKPIQTKDWSWSLNLNFASNRNRVLELITGDDGVDQFELAAARWADVSVAAVVGQNFGAILGRDFLYAPNGARLIDATTGLPRFTETFKVLGNASWKWTGGLSNSISYKNFGLSALLDVKTGADIYSMTQRSNYKIGKAKATLEGREQWYSSEEQRQRSGKDPGEWTATGGYIAKGVVAVKNQDGSTSYTPNTKMVDPTDYWSIIAQSTPVPFIYDNSYVKVREITFSYTLPKKWIGKFAEQMTVAFVARNPFILYKNIPGIDPESTYSINFGMGLENASLPIRRSFGMNLNMNF